MCPTRISLTSSNFNQHFGQPRLQLLTHKTLILLLIIIQINYATQCCCTSMHDIIEHDIPYNVLPSYWNNNITSTKTRFARDLSMEYPPNDQIFNPTLPNDRLSPNPASFVPQTLPLWSSMLGSPSNTQEDVLDTHIKNILIPRVSGTPGNIQVRQYIANTLKRFNYDVELDEFQASTPVGRVGFANIIGSSNPKACRQLVLACHYDSKMMDGFLGAIDSAVPCAMLLKMAETFKDSFRDTSESNNSKTDLSLRFIFFDGEEAFVQWTSTDSLYGSRHLAAKWSRQLAPSSCSPKKTELSRIELFVLLDLIGTTDTTFVMYSTRLRHHYEALQQYERAHMTKSGIGQLQARRDAAFRSRTLSLDFVEDDHVPFKQRGVPILSLLAHPFPRVWHTIDDNYSAIDFPRTRRILSVLEEFVSNYSSSSTN